MRTLLTSTSLVLLFIIGKAQNSLTPIQLLKGINSISQAKNMVASNRTVYSHLITLHASVDTGIMYRKIYERKTGDIFTIGNNTYKILHDTINLFNSIEYILLDGNTLTKTEIDGLRIEIMKQYKRGESMENLIKKYNMDGRGHNSEGGWQNVDKIYAEFNRAIKKHKSNEIFTLDFHHENYFFIVKNTLASKKAKELTLIKISNFK